MTSQPLFVKRLGHPHFWAAFAVNVLIGLAAVWLMINDGHFVGRSSALVAGFVFGVALQRGELSMVRAWRDFTEFKDSGQLLGFLSAMLVAGVLTLGTLAWFHLGAPHNARIGPVHWLLPIVGFSFGFACVIARGGVMVHMRRLSEGSMIAAPALLATFVGFVIGVALWPWSWRVALGDAPRPWLPDAFGLWGALAVEVGVILALIAAFWRFRPRQRPDHGSFMRRVFIDPWPAWVAGALLGVLVAVGYAVGEPLGLIAECVTLARWLATALGLAPTALPGLDSGIGGFSAPLELFGPSRHIAILVGFIAGAFAAALASGRFKFTGFTLREGVEMVVGGLILACAP